MIRAIAALALLVGCLATSTVATADERILSYDSVLAVQPDGSLDVIENIRVRAEGTNIRRGIYRDFPTRYRDGVGNQVKVDFELLDVTRDGTPEPHFTEGRSNGVRINTGNDDFLPTPGEFTFSIHYRTTRQLGFFPDHDELYWNAIGPGWMFPIDKASARVTLPAPVPSNQLRLDAYSGGIGMRGTNFTATSPGPGVALFNTTQPLSAHQGLTISVGFPKGIVAEPTSADRVRWFLRDNLGVLVGFLGVLLLGAFYLWRWICVGRDPDAGPIFPRYEPPQGFAPGELRMLRRMGNDRLTFSSDVVDMGVRGYLQIHEGKGKGGWRLVRNQGASLELLGDSQRALASKLFASGSEIELTNTQASRVSAAIIAHERKMLERLKPRYFKSNSSAIVIGFAAFMLIDLIAFAVSRGNGIPVLMAVNVLAIILHGVFAILLKAPTADGRKLLDEIEGLRMYLGVAERDELKSLQGPGQPPVLDAARYEALLPYAMALDVEQAWTKKFTEAVGAAGVLDSSPTWYHGSNAPGRMGLASMGSSLGNALTSQIAASATPPGSSSGGSGGGSSGGGGGGGGGGGR